MEDHRFDQLARSLAQPVSRRHVLKVLAGTAVGGIFASRLTPAWASNSTCAHFCNQVFGENTPAAEQCTMDRSLCSSACGPGGSGGTLCGPQSGGYYTSYSGTTCCPAGISTCIAETCCANASVCGSGTTAVCGCPSGQTCTNGQCVATCLGYQHICSSNADCCSGNCGASAGSRCCASGSIANLPSGVPCIQNSDCCSNICVGFNPVSGAQGNCA